MFQKMAIIAIEEQALARIARVKSNDKQWFSRGQMEQETNMRNTRKKKRAQQERQQLIIRPLIISTCSTTSTTNHRLFILLNLLLSLLIVSEGKLARRAGFSSAYDDVSNVYHGEDDELRKTMRTSGANNFDDEDVGRLHQTLSVVSHDQDGDTDHQAPWRTAETSYLAGNYAHLLSDPPLERSRAPKMVKRQDREAHVNEFPRRPTDHHQFISVLNNQSSIVYNNPSSSQHKPLDPVAVVTITTNSTSLEKCNNNTLMQDSESKFGINQISSNSTGETSKRDQQREIKLNSTATQSNDSKDPPVKVDLTIIAVNASESQQQHKLNRILTESNKLPSANASTVSPPVARQRSPTQMISYTAVPQLIGKKSSTQHAAMNSSIEPLNTSTTRRPVTSTEPRRQESYSDEQWWAPRTNIYRASKQLDSKRVNAQSVKQAKTQATRSSNLRKQPDYQQQTTWSPVLPSSSLFTIQATTQTNSFRKPPSEFGEREPTRATAGSTKFRERQTTPSILDEILASKPQASLGRPPFVAKPTLADQLESLDVESATTKSLSSTEGILVESHPAIGEHQVPTNEQQQPIRLVKTDKLSRPANGRPATKTQTPMVTDELLVGPFKSESEAPATITLSGVVYQKSGSSAAIASSSGLVGDLNDMNLAAGSSAEPSTATGDSNKIGKGHHLYEDLDDDDDHHHSLISSLAQNQGQSGEDDASGGAQAKLHEQANPQTTKSNSIVLAGEKFVWPQHSDKTRQQQTGDPIYGYLGQRRPQLGTSPSHMHTHYDLTHAQMRPTRDQPAQQQQWAFTGDSGGFWRHQAPRQKFHHHQHSLRSQPRVRQPATMSFDEQNNAPALFYADGQPSQSSVSQQWQAAGGNGEHGFYAAATENEAATAGLQPQKAATYVESSSENNSTPKQHHQHLAAEQQHPVAGAMMAAAGVKQSPAPIVIVQKDVKPVKYHLMRAYLKLRRLLRPFEATYVFPGDAHSTLMRRSLDPATGSRVPSDPMSQATLGVDD